MLLFNPPVHTAWRIFCIQLWKGPKVVNYSSENHTSIISVLICIRDLDNSEGLYKHMVTQTSKKPPVALRGILCFYESLLTCTWKRISWFKYCDLFMLTMAKIITHPRAKLRIFSSNINSFQMSSTSAIDIAWEENYSNVCPNFATTVCCCINNER